MSCHSSLDYNAVDWHKILVYKNSKLYWLWNYGIAGDVKNGYLRIRYKGHEYAAARIIWVMVYGSIDPTLEIDHIDRNKLNNDVNNLRLVTFKVNLQNKGDYANNTSGIKGVNFNITSGKWVARTNQITGKREFLGSYLTSEEAVVARLLWESKQS